MTTLTNPPTPPLSIHTKLRDLALVDFQVGESTPCENVVRRLEDDPTLSGVVVLDEQSQLRGMLTRTTSRLREQLPSRVPGPGFSPFARRLRCH
jgi:hypothetical protein